MENNKVQAMAVETSEKIQAVFGEKMHSLAIYDVVEDSNHQAFRIKFIAYDYFTMQFNYERDLCGFSISFNDQFGTSLEDDMRSYSGTHDWETYIKGIMAKVELRIPDKFLQSKGWL